MEITENNKNEYHSNFNINRIDGYIDDGIGVYLVVDTHILGCGNEPLFVYVDSEDGREYICLNETIIYLETLTKA